jgi:Fe2+ or Zn2+ uptake regulation protein
MLQDSLILLDKQQFPTEKLRFTDLFDLGSSYYGNLDQAISQFNDSLPPGRTVKDKRGFSRTYKPVGYLRQAHRSLARQLMFIVKQQMDEVRRIDPEQFKSLLDEDYFVITTNRGILRSMLNNDVSKSTIWNYLNQLMEAGIVSCKESTSRSRTIITNENGHQTVLYKPTDNGRGDFRLHIPKSLFHAKVVFLEKNKNNEFTGQNDDQIQNLEQSPDNPLIKRIKKNHCGQSHNEECGVLPTSEQKEPKTLKTNIKPELDSKKIPAGQKSGQKIAKIHLIEGTGEHISHYERIRKRKFMLNKSVGLVLPKEGKGKYLALLYAQLVSQLYPQESYSNYLRDQEIEIKNMLSVHMIRTGLPEDQAFLRVSRGIYLAFLHLQKNEDSYIYGPLTYLRVDDEITRGTLKFVIDNWVRLEVERTNKAAKKGSDFIKWQYAYARSEDIFQRIVETVAQGYSQTKSAFREGFRELDTYCARIKISDKKREEVKHSLKSRCENIFQEIEKFASEEEDPIMRDILRLKALRTG